MFLKNFILISYVLFYFSDAYSQVNIQRPDVIESHVVVKNYIKNPSALKNTLGTATSSAAVSRDTSAGNKIDGV